MHPFPLVLIEWLDHVSETTWVSPHELSNAPERCLTVGWLIKEDERGLTLVSCIDPAAPETGQMGGTQYVIKSCITSVKTLRKAKTKK